MSTIETKIVNVPAISCEHCIHTIENEVAEIAGVKAVQADQASKQVTIQFERPATWEAIQAVMVEINYPPVSAN